MDHSNYLLFFFQFLVTASVIRVFISLWVAPIDGIQACGRHLSFANGHLRLAYDPDCPGSWLTLQKPDRNVHCFDDLPYDFVSDSRSMGACPRCCGDGAAPRCTAPFCNEQKWQNYIHACWHGMTNAMLLDSSQLYCGIRRIATGAATVYVGSGGTLKSAAFKIEQAMLGAAAQTLDVSCFQDESGNEWRKFGERVVGAASARTQEPKAGAKMHDSITKRVITGEELVTRVNYGLSKMFVFDYIKWGLEMNPNCLNSLDAGIRREDLEVHEIEQCYADQCYRRYWLIWKQPVPKEKLTMSKPEFDSWLKTDELKQRAWAFHVGVWRKLGHAAMIGLAGGSRTSPLTVAALDARAGATGFNMLHTMRQWLAIGVTGVFPRPKRSSYDPNAAASDEEEDLTGEGKVWKAHAGLGNLHDPRKRFSGTIGVYAFRAMDFLDGAAHGHGTGTRADDLRKAATTEGLRWLIDITGNRASVCKIDSAAFRAALRAHAKPADHPRTFCSGEWDTRLKARDARVAFEPAHWVDSEDARRWETVQPPPMTAEKVWVEENINLAALKWFAQAEAADGATVPQTVFCFLGEKTKRGDCGRFWKTQVLLSSSCLYAGVASGVLSILCSSVLWSSVFVVVPFA
jgi:hypothetical protein